MLFIRSNQQVKSTITQRLEAAGQNLNDYITDMEKSSTWADDNALFAASALFDVTICILTEDSSAPIYIGSSTC